MSYNVLPPKEIIEKTIKAVKDRNVTVYFENTKEEALKKLKNLIPAGAEIMTGGSTTLEQIGFADYLKSGRHPWNNLKDKILAEKDPAKQNELRKMSVLSQYFAGSVHAVTETGVIIIASATGSQLPSYAFSSDNLIWVIGCHKIVPTFEDALKRIREYTFPLEDKRMKSVGYSGSTIGKMLIFEREIMPNRKINLIFVNEVLGF
ncbi:MAG: lactate utilization protein [bacterium]|nr:lactate utilization protein [bacterium]